MMLHKDPPADEPLTDLPSEQGAAGQGPGVLQIRLLGCFAIQRARRNRAPELGSNGRRLAAYLLFYLNRVHRREKLIDLFWTNSGPDQGRAAFSTALWKLRQVLSSASGEQPMIQTTSEYISMEVANTSVIDVHKFECVVAKALTADVPADQTLGGAVELYGGSFLEGYDDDWVLGERERLECLYIRVLTQLMRSRATEGRYEEALACARRILATDPMRETAQRATMLLYVVNGQRGHALRQFRRCQEVLRRECDVDPMPETSALELMIRNGEVFRDLPDLMAGAFGTSPKA